MRLDIRPLTPRLMDDMGCVLRGSWGSTCWCMYPRLSDAEMKALPGDGKLGPRRREAMTALARRRKHKPGLVAYLDGAPVGWVAVAPRPDLGRVDRSRATPRVDETDVWVIPCVTVTPPARGKGVAVALIEAAAAYAFEQGAPAVEAYPRAGNTRTKDDNAFYGTEPLFHRAGFTVIQGPPDDLPKNWTPRVTMRMTAA